MKRRKRSLRKAINARIWYEKKKMVVEKAINTRTDYEKKKTVVEKGNQRPNLV